MAYDRYERERGWRDSRSDNDERGQRGFDRDRQDYGRGRNEERGFFDRMSDEFRSWFSDDEDRNRREWGRDDGREQGWRDRPRSDERSEPARGGFGERDYNRDYRRENERSYQPMAGDYGRSGREERGNSDWDRDSYRRTSFAGSRATSNHDDQHYSEMRRRQAEDLDRDYDEYRRERASQFENDFGSWRERRQSKRQLLAGIREHMEVVGKDEKHVGTVDRVAGDRIILTKSDPEAGGAHHSLTCTNVDRVEGDKVFLDMDADDAKKAWRDENRDRALFEREDQGRAGPHILDRSFSGTYR